MLTLYVTSMSAYKKMRVAYLREVCEERGIDCVGLKKGAGGGPTET